MHKPEKTITLANLAEATEQEVFDYVVHHLLTQGAKSAMDIYDPIPKCMYKSPTGLKCAAGCLISDAEYQPSMEGLLWSELVRSGEVKTDAHVSLISRLQSIHDRTSPSLWRCELDMLASEKELKFKF